VGAVALGGIGSALAVGAIAWAWPELRTLGRMTAIETDAASETDAADEQSAAGAVNI